MFTNLSVIRRKVQESSSPELRQLESELLQCLVNQQNQEALESKLKKTDELKEREEQYAELVRTQDFLHCEGAYLQNNRRRRKDVILSMEQKEQAANATIRDCEMCVADIAADIALSRDVSKELTLEAEKAQEVRLREQDLRVKDLKRHDQQLRRDRVANAADQLHLARLAALEERKLDLKHQLDHEETVHSRLQQSIRVAMMGGELMQHDALCQEVRDLRAEVEEAEHEVWQREQLQHRFHAEQLANQKLAQARELQIREKKLIVEEQRRFENEYLIILKEVQELECNLEQLTAAARKRKMLQQRDEVERLLQLRRLQLRAIQVRNKLNEKAEQEFHNLRSALTIAEEERLLHDNAPHLLSHLTPALRKRLHAICLQL